VAQFPEILTVMVLRTKGPSMAYRSVRLHVALVTAFLVAASFRAWPLTAATAVPPHHSIAGVYDGTASITLDGVVSAFQFVNPHPFIVMTVAGDGRSETWKLELDNRFELVDVGVKTDTLKAGDRIVARGSKARDGSHSIYALRIDRPADGFWYEQVGSSPRVGRR
jgi:hypothetical protein